MLTSSELLRTRLGFDYMGQELAVLDKLADKEITQVAFYKDAKWTSNGQAASYFLARYFLPVADLNELVVGIHVLPARVASGRFMVAQLDPESGRLIDFAGSIQSYIYRNLLEFEADDEDIDQDLGIVRTVFGGDFYKPGQHGKFSANDLERVMIDKFGGAPIDYEGLSYFAQARQSVDEQLDWLRHGSEAFPESMYLHGKLTQLCLQQGDYEAAAQGFVRSLMCFHHTVYKLDVKNHYALGRELLAKVPSVFSDTDRNDLTLDGKARLEWIVSLFEAGQIETSVKLLCDFRHDSQTDVHPVLFEFLRLHYEKLGWKWALAWCDLCAVDTGYEKGNYEYMGKPLDSGWDQPVRRVIGLN